MNAVITKERPDSLSRDTSSCKINSIFTKLIKGAVHDCFDYRFSSAGSTSRGHRMQSSIQHAHVYRSARTHALVVRQTSTQPTKNRLKRVIFDSRAASDYLTSVKQKNCTNDVSVLRVSVPNPGPFLRQSNGHNPSRPSR